MPITLEKATLDDLPMLLALCRAASRSRGSTWDEVYPDREILTEDIEAERLMKLVLASECIGMFALGDMGELADFREDGDGERSLEFARLAIHPAHQGKGLAGQAVEAALHMARASGADVVRLLVAKSNPAARAVYQRAGFTFLQNVWMYDNDYTYCRIRLTQEGGSR